MHLLCNGTHTQKRLLFGYYGSEGINFFGVFMYTFLLKKIYTSEKVCAIKILRARVYTIDTCMYRLGSFALPVLQIASCEFFFMYRKLPMLVT